MKLPRLAGVALALAVLLVSVTARASRVRFVSEASESFNRRVVAELRSVGFDVDEANDASAPLPEGSVAVVHAKNQPAQVEVWLIDAPGRAVLSAVIAREPVSGEDADSTKVAERVRALLQPLAAREPELVPVATDTPPPPAPLAPAPHDTLPARVRTPAAQTPKRFLLEGGGAVASQPGGAALSFVAGARYGFARPFAARAFASFPLLGSTLEGAGASADLDAWLGGLSLLLDFLPPDSDVRLALGAGGGVAWLRAEGHAPDPRKGRSSDELAGLAFADAAFGYRVAGDFSLLSGALLGVALPRTDIEFSGSRVGTFGRPLVVGTLSVGYDL
ncbi:MAG: hypothetical protein IPM35_19310 [Myxococcales bacterium]|nr:hypothetical protein [Myxococcales bacterium]